MAPRARDVTCLRAGELLDERGVGARPAGRWLRQAAGHHDGAHPAVLSEAGRGRGYVKAKDLLPTGLTISGRPSAWYGVERLRQAEVAHAEPEGLRGQVARIKDIWQRLGAQLGLVPMTDAEFDHPARQLRPVVNRAFARSRRSTRTRRVRARAPDFNQAEARERPARSVLPLSGTGGRSTPCGS